MLAKLTKRRKSNQFSKISMLQTIYSHKESRNYPKLLYIKQSNKQQEHVWSTNYSPFFIPISSIFVLLYSHLYYPNVVYLLLIFENIPKNRVC